MVPLSSLPDPGNLFLSSHLFSLGSRSPGRRNMYTTTDTQQVSSNGEMSSPHLDIVQVSQTPNVTIGYVVAMRAGGRDQKRICFIYMKVAVMMIILVTLMMMMLVRMMMVVFQMGDGGDTWGTQYSWTVDKTACLRNIRSAAADQHLNICNGAELLAKVLTNKKLNFANVFVTDTSMCFCVVRKTFWNLNKTLSMLSKVGIENFYDQTTRNNSTQLIALSKLF